MTTRSTPVPLDAIAAADTLEAVDTALARAGVRTLTLSRDHKGWCATWTLDDGHGGNAHGPTPAVALLLAAARAQRLETALRSSLELAS